MKRSDIKFMPVYFDRYILQVDNIELDDAFQKNINTLEILDVAALKSLGNKTYEPGKWTIKDIFQHIIDTERVEVYRALRFARRDGIIPEGYEPDIFAANANVQDRTLESMIEELVQLHQSTRLMFQSFDDDTLHVVGINWNKEISVLAMGFLIAGHIIHHLRIIKEKYLPLLYEVAG